jgi:hypothetical protein
MSNFFMRNRFNHDQNHDSENFDSKLLESINSRIRTGNPDVEFFMRHRFDNDMKHDVKFFIPPRINQDHNPDVKFFVVAKRNPDVD